jgi:hypothetical protein
MRPFLAVAAALSPSWVLSGRLRKRIECVFGLDGLGLTKSNKYGDRHISQNSDRHFIQPSTNQTHTPRFLCFLPI